MCQLHANGGTILVDEVDDGSKGSDLLVGPQPYITHADPRTLLDGCALDEDQSCSTQCELAEMNQMPSSR
jgi:hypothetical protein